MKYWLIGGVAPLLWGTTYAVTQHWMSEMDPLWVAALRILIPGLLLMPILSIRTLRQGWKGMLILGGLNIGLFTTLLFQAISRLPGGVAATLVSTVPLQILLFRWLMKQRPPVTQLMAAAGGTFGVGLLVWRAAEPLDSVGVVLALLAGSSMAIGMMLIPKLTSGVAPLQMAAGQLLFSGIALTLLTALSGAPVPEFDAASMLAMGWISPIGMGVGYFCWFKALQHIPGDKLAFLGLVNPVIAVFCGLLLMAEQLAAVQIMGMVLVLGCVLLAQWKPRARLENPGREHETGIEAANPLI